TADGSKAVDDWVEFACPSREDFRAQRIEEAVALVREVRPAALSLDFIRYFVFWEMVGPDQDPRSLPDSCFCPRCLSRFTDEMGRAIPPGDPTESAGWIYEHALDDWVEFKRQTIIGMVEEIIAAVREVQPEIAVNLHAVPWRETDFDRAVVRIAGQDHSVLGGMVNYLSPMCYSFMQYQPPEWIASVVQDLDRQSACPVL
ncbi:MAG: hypothetical protein GY906_20895, partial [bacterium]|nr:hypothetical protein [bacterium]